MSIVVGTGKIYEGFDPKAGGNFSFKEYYNFNKTPIHIGLGAGAVYLRDVLDATSSISSSHIEHEEFLVEIPFSLGVGWRAGRIDFFISTDIAYCFNLAWIGHQELLVLEPQAEILFYSRKKRLAIGVQVKMIRGLGNDPSYQPYLLGAGLVFRNHKNS